MIEPTSAPFGHTANGSHRSLLAVAARLTISVRLRRLGPRAQRAGSEFAEVTTALLDLRSLGELLVRFALATESGTVSNVRLLWECRYCRDNSCGDGLHHSF
jgi:hypothetical protein